MDTSVYKHLTAYLMSRKTKSVTLEQLKEQCPTTTYDIFAQTLRALEDTDILRGVAAGGTDTAGLSYRYRIKKGNLFAPVAAAIRAEAAALGLSGQLDISWYYMQPLARWEQDREGLQCLDAYLEAPLPEASRQQRSFDIFGDEKYLDGPGSHLLAHTGLSPSDLGIVSEVDPLMMAFNPSAPEAEPHIHIIVENKVPYMALLPLLTSTNWTSLIWGCGWKITANLSLLPKQCGYPHDRHLCLYAGDWDWEGLRIWHSLPSTQRCQVLPWLSFYRKYLAYEAPEGKKNQKPAPEGLAHFISFLPAEEGMRLQQTLQTGHYYPQEIVSPQEYAELAREVLPYGLGKLF